MNRSSNPPSFCAGGVARAFFPALAIWLVFGGSFVHAEILAPGSPHSDDFVLGPTGNWGAGATVTYSFAAGAGYSSSEGGGNIVPLESFMPYTLAQIKAQFRAAFDAWEAVANITFVEVPDSGHAFNASGASGDIRLGGHTFDGAGGTLAHGYYPPPNGSSAAGDIHFDSAESWVIGFAGPGFDIFQVAAHEIGHAIGLNHSNVPGSLMNPFYSEAFSGPQADDIAGALAMYGAPLSGVPEPSTGLLVVVGLLGGMLAVRRAKA